MDNMFHLEGIDEAYGSNSSDERDEPLAMRAFGRRRSTSSASDETATSVGYSSGSCATRTTSSSEESNDSALGLTMTVQSSKPTPINIQQSAPIEFTIKLPSNKVKNKDKSSDGASSTSSSPGITKKNSGGKSHGKRSKLRRDLTLGGASFSDLYYLTGEHLGQGAYATVQTCVRRDTGVEYAVKIIEKRPENSRTRVIKEIETFHLCSGHPNIVQLIEYFEENDKFYLIFEKMRGGPLLNHIQQRICFTEHEACLVVRDIVDALKYLHDRGIAHRDLKPENILCTHPDRVSPVKLCDLDLASKMVATMHTPTAITTPELQSPVGSAEFMAPEVVDAFVGEALSYDKRCDLWSLGVILYIMLCGYPPFYGECDAIDCGWDRGLPCQDCQDSLFARIQKGEYYFPDEEWSHISPWVKDLIRHLLVKDASQRYTVDDVMRHDWLHMQAPKTPLMTPDILLRNDSARDLAQMAGHFDVMNRFGAWHQRLSAQRDRMMGMGPEQGFIVAPTTVTANNTNPIARKLTPMLEQFQEMFTDKKAIIKTEQ
jgi:MAP kinase interacting serine/threonine kinase